MSSASSSPSFGRCSPVATRTVTFRAGDAALQEDADHRPEKRVVRHRAGDVADEDAGGSPVPRKACQRRRAGGLGERPLDGAGRVVDHRQRVLAKHGDFAPVGHAHRKPPAARTPARRSSQSPRVPRTRRRARRTSTLARPEHAARAAPSCSVPHPNPGPVSPRPVDTHGLGLPPPQSPEAVRGNPAGHRAARRDRAPSVRCPRATYNIAHAHPARSRRRRRGRHVRGGRARRLARARAAARLGAGAGRARRHRHRRAHRPRRRCADRLALRGARDEWRRRRVARARRQRPSPRRGVPARASSLPRHPHPA